MAADKELDRLDREILRLIAVEYAARYRDEINDAYRVDFAEQYLGHPSAAPLVQLELI